MPRCSVCARDMDEQARFCSACGATLTAGDQPREQRRMVTALFCDLVGSTALGERLDVETLRQVMHRYYAAMSEPIQLHGGMIAKFIGDAVVAFFGIPVTREDDAVRAVRAAAEMRDGLEVLNKELERDYGTIVDIRIGVNSGEVVVYGGGDEVLGDPINVAARLERLAPAGEIFIGDTTRRLAHGCVEATPITAELRGKSQPITAWKLDKVLPDAGPITRRLDSPLVGRDQELSVLRDAFDRSSREHACELITVLGPAGVGKSRLIHELCSAVTAQARVLTGRCLSYGQGITYLPLRQIVAQAAQIPDAQSADEAVEHIRSVFGGDRDAGIVAEHVAAMVDFSEASVPKNEAFWSVRRFFEAVARRGPLIVVFEDIHWAEPTLLDLIDHIVEFARDVPLLIVASSRPDLLEERPAWLDGKKSLVLDPLSERDSVTLIRNLLGSLPIPVALADRIAHAAGGNPLFVEEMIAMLVDDGLLKREGSEWTADGDLSDITVPPTIQMILAARLDRLEAEERVVLECASVLGSTFRRDAVEHLSDPNSRGSIDSIFAQLVAKGLLRPHESTDPSSLRFRHVLIEDACYRTTPKQRRGLLHQAAAGWLDQVTPEADDLVGYHLERTTRYMVELGAPQSGVEEMGRRASARLATAGTKAMRRRDGLGAANLLGRAIALLPPADQDRTQLMSAQADALVMNNDYPAALDVAESTLARAQQEKDRRLKMRARLQRSWLLMNMNSSAFRLEEARELVKSGVELFEKLDDHRSLARAWRFDGDLWAMVGKMSSCWGSWERAAEHARRAGDDVEANEFVAGLPFQYSIGPMPTMEAIGRAERIVSDVQGMPGALQRAKMGLGCLYGDAGRFDEARAAIADSLVAAEELGLPMGVAMVHAFAAGVVEWLARDLVASERHVRMAHRMFTDLKQFGYDSSAIAFLGGVLCEKGSYDEAWQCADQSRGEAADDDAVSQSAWRAVLARVFARTSRMDEAMALATESVNLVRDVDIAQEKIHAWRALGEVHALAERPSDAIADYDNALTLAEGKQLVSYKQILLDDRRAIGIAR